jgi:hypothetical protein
VVLGALVAVAVLGGCSEDGAPLAAVQRYCDLVVRFPTPPGDDDPDFRAEMVRYVETNSDYFEELIDATPAEIKDDVQQAVVTLRRVAAGELPTFGDLDLRKADEYQAKHCE